MKIVVPSHEEYQKEKRKKLRNFITGLLTGIIVFGLLGSRVLFSGFDHVEFSTWVALGFGALSFGFLAMWFGNDFWKVLLVGFRNH